MNQKREDPVPHPAVGRGFSGVFIAATTVEKVFVVSQA